jgi:aminoglycoside/choline kinase family phosphotransferase
MTRDQQLDHFLAAAGYAHALRLPLAQDGSFRRYFRIPDVGILMDAPPPEDVRPFLRIGALLAAGGLSVPAILYQDPESGLLLLEDFGDELLHVTRQADGETLFDAAIDALVALQAVPLPPDLPRWDTLAMVTATEAVLFDWWWPARFATPAPAAARLEIGAALAEMLAPLAAAPPVLVHRDYFAANLIWLPGRDNVRRIGVLDFQSAAAGPAAYDLASLTQNARLDTPPALAARALDRYAAARGLDRGELADQVAICAAQRHLRVSAQWVRLALRDGKTHYLAHGPRTWRLLTQALRAPACRPLSLALDHWIPLPMRSNPPPLAAGA